MEGSGNAVRRMLVVGGATATGKSRLAVQLAEHLGGEVISADSMQVYRLLDIGTAKPSKEDMGDIPHHLIDIADPAERYSVADFLKDAAAAADDISARGRLPILCGGTGLYISSLLSGIRFSDAPPDLRLREEIAAEYEADKGERLLKEIGRADPEYRGRLNPNDKKRVVRAVEMLRGEGVTPTESLALSQAGEKFDHFDIIPTDPNRERLYARIGLRGKDMMQRGLLKEARLVYDNRARFETAAQAIGYKEFFPYFEDRSNIDDCTARFIQATRRYAKRQITWFKRFSGMRPDPEHMDFENILLNIRKHWNL